MDIESLKVPLDRLTVRCDPDSLGFETTQEVAPLEGTVGQDRAVRALEFGLGIDAPGYNIYVVGYPGTGRTTTLTSFLRQATRERLVPDDWCYVHNFHDPLQPVAVRLPAGIGRQLVQDMNELIEDCLRNIPGVFETQEYRDKVEEAVRGVQERKETISNGIEQAARQQGFIVQPSSTGVR